MSCFWRRPRPIAFRELRFNEQIRIPNVRLFDDETGETLGIVPIEQARRLAVERELDLVEWAPMAQPPVCKLMDYGRYKFEAIKKEKDARQRHNIIRVKEMKLRPKISENDFKTKYGYVRHFLADGDKVKLTIMFRGREMVHQEYGRRLLERLANDLKDVAIIERMPLVEGRNMIMIMSPLAKKQSRPETARGEGDGNGEAGSAPVGATTPVHQSNGSAGASAPAGGPNGSTTEPTPAAEPAEPTPTAIPTQGSPAVSADQPRRSTQTNAQDPNP